MEPTDQSPEEVYSVWALPPEPVRGRLRRLMAALRAAHGGPAFEPHLTVVGAVRLRRSAAVEALRAAAAGVRPFTACVAGEDRGGFYYGGCLQMEPTPEVMATIDRCCGHFGYQIPRDYCFGHFAFTPHVSLIYRDWTKEEEDEARRMVEEMDEDIRALRFEISELALYTTEPGNIESWELVDTCHLRGSE